MLILHSDYIDLSLFHCDFIHVINMEWHKFLKSCFIKHYEYFIKVSG